jgi:hypothetical protein
MTRSSALCRYDGQNFIQTSDYVIGIVACKTHWRFDPQRVALQATFANQQTALFG